MFTFEKLAECSSFFWLYSTCCEFYISHILDIAFPCLTDLRLVGFFFAPASRSPLFSTFVYLFEICTAQIRQIRPCCTCVSMFTIAWRVIGLRSFLFFLLLRWFKFKFLVFMIPTSVIFNTLLRFFIHWYNYKSFVLLTVECKSYLYTLRFYCGVDVFLLAGIW